MATFKNGSRVAQVQPCFHSPGCPCFKVRVWTICQQTHMRWHRIIVLNHEIWCFALDSTGFNSNLPGMYKVSFMFPITHPKIASILEAQTCAFAGIAYVTPGRASTLKNHCHSFPVRVWPWKSLPKAEISGYVSKIKTHLATWQKRNDYWLLAIHSSGYAQILTSKDNGSRKRTVFLISRIPQAKSTATICNILGPDRGSHEDEATKVACQRQNLWRSRVIGPRLDRSFTWRALNWGKNSYPQMDWKVKRKDAANCLVWELKMVMMVYIGMFQLRRKGMPMDMVHGCPWSETSTI